MELFEDGGLRDEGGMVDEESGNEVPVGSTRKEVRDDIPAMLSEGEFVFPADVVRYIGLENLMRMRQDAKQGLKQMEAMGQMGNGDEATMPDDLPFGMMDLIIVEGEEEPEVEKKAQGGVVHMNEGGFTTNSFRVPKFDPRNQDVRQYENAEGKKRNIPFFDGKPLYPIPEGYFPVGTVEEEKDQTKEAIPTDDDDSPTPPPQSEFQKSGGWDMDTSATDGKALDMWIKEAQKVSTAGNVAAGIGAAINPLFGGLIALSNKYQKKQIMKMLDEKIAQAKKTPIQGQVAALEKVKERLTTDKGKGILGKVIDGIIDEVGGALGLTEEEKLVSKVGASANTNQSPTEPDSVTEKAIDKVNQTTALLKAAGINPETVDSKAFGTSLGRAVAKLGANASAEDLANEIKQTYKADVAGSTLKEDGTYDISSWFTDAPAPETPEAIPTAAETRAAIAAPGDADLRPRSTYDEVPTPTDVGNALAEKSTAPEAPQIATPAKLSGPMLGEGDIEQTGIDAMPEGFRDQDKIADALGSVGRQAMTQPKFESPIPPQYQQLKTALDELRESTEYRGPVSGMSMKEKLEDPMAPFKIGYEKLSNAISQAIGGDDTPTPPTTTTTPPPSSGGNDNDDDDPPSFASVGDNATAAQQASQNVTTTVEKDESGNVTGVTTTGGTEEEQQTMEDYVTSAAAGAKGGLFTRRKNKKK